MILSVTLSKPVKNISEILGEDYTRVKIRLATAASSGDQNYFAEFYTQKQVFHKKMSQSQVKDFIESHGGKTFKNCLERTESEEITILANKKGKITELRKKISTGNKDSSTDDKQTESDSEQMAVSRGGIPGLHLYQPSSSKKKNYLIPEGSPVPFLVLLGLMTDKGKVIQAKFDKFRQINRFLECVNDILDQVASIKKSEGRQISQENPLRIVDFGSGKSYLTFALQYYLCEIKKIPAEIFGLDLKEDVIQYCSSLAKKLDLKNLSFAVGDISSFGEDKEPDIIVTLHACDTATDYALNYAIRRGAKAILSVPCCQHEINSQLKPSSVAEDSPLIPLLKYGLIKERFSALLTDAARAEILEEKGYKVQILEFIEESATPKNLLIRAVLTGKEKKAAKKSLLQSLGLNQTLERLMKDEK